MNHRTAHALVMLVALAVGTPGARAVAADSSPRVAVVRALPATGADYGVSIVPYGDDAIVTGYTTLANGDEALLLRIDHEGIERWRRTLPANGDGALWSVCPLGDGTFLGVGWAKGAAGDLDAMAARFDSVGTVLWQRTYAGPDKERLWSVDRTPHGVVAAGESAHESDGTSQALVLRIDLDGNESGRVTHGGQPVERVFSVQAMSDGGYVLAGQSGSGPREGAGFDARIVRYDADDGVRWSRVWGGPGYDVAHDVRELPDGGLLVTGYTFVNAARGTDAFALALTPAGAVRWARTYGGAGDDRAIHAALLPSGGFAQIGYRRDASGNSDLVIRALGGRGEPRWERRFGGRGPELGRSLAVTGDGDVIAVGHSGSYGPRERILYVRVEDVDAPPAGAKR